VVDVCDFDLDVDVRGTCRKNLLCLLPPSRRHRVPSDVYACDADARLHPRSPRVICDLHWDGTPPDVVRAVAGWRRTLRRAENTCCGMCERRSCRLDGVPDRGSGIH